MLKRTISDKDITSVELFLDELFEKKGDFGWEEIWAFERKHGFNKSEIYHLTNHTTFVVVMTEGARSKSWEDQRFAFTEKGMLICSLGGYREWEKYETERIEFVRSEPSRARVTSRVATAALIISIVGAVATWRTSSIHEANLKRQIRLDSLAAIPDTTKIKVVDQPTQQPLLIHIPDTVSIKSISQ